MKRWSHPTRNLHRRNCYATGYIIELASAHGAPVRWSYVLADGQPTALQSVFAQRELETQIQDYYFLKPSADLRHSA